MTIRVSQNELMRYQDPEVLWSGSRITDGLVIDGPSPAAVSIRMFEVRVAPELFRVEVHPCVISKKN